MQAGARFTYPEGWKAELTYMVTGYLGLPRWFTRTQTVTHPSRPTNPAVHGRESNSQTVDHESDALTTTLPSHRKPGRVMAALQPPFCLQLV